MISALSTVEIFGPRALFQSPAVSPPRGTPSRILKLRLGRSFRAPAPPRSRTSYATVVESAPVVGAGDRTGERDNLTFGERLPLRPFPVELLESSSLLHHVLSQSSVSSSSTAAPDGRCDKWEERGGIPGRLHDPVPEYHRTKNLGYKFLKAIEWGDVRAVWDILRLLFEKRRFNRPTVFSGIDQLFPHTTLGEAARVKLTSLNKTHLLEELISMLPQNTFSELLRMLELESLQRHLQPDSDNLQISQGVVEQTPLGRLVDEFGVRKLPQVAWELAKILCDIRLEAGQSLHHSDYKVLLRLAGATQNTTNTKFAWAQYHLGTDHDAIRPDLWTEFVKARFLTEPVYCQYDLTRHRVRPANLYGGKIGMRWSVYGRLERMRLKMERRQRNRFGHNPSVPFVNEHMTRQLRQWRPIRRLLKAFKKRHIPLDEETQCAFLVALSRSNSQNTCGEALAYWGLHIQRDENGTLVKVPLDKGELRRMFSSAPGSPMVPTGRLLSAVVDSFCCMGQVNAAIEIMRTLSETYGIPITEEQWFRLLEWTYVQSSIPARWEWAVARFHRHALPRAAVEHVWDVMTSDAYNVKPGPAQYFLWAKNAIGQGRLGTAMERISLLRGMYEERLWEYEAALTELYHAQVLELDQDRALRRYEKAYADKWAARYYVQTCCYHLLKRLDDRRGPANSSAVSRLPRFLEEFSEFMPTPVRYKVATGTIELRNAGSRCHRVFGSSAYRGTTIALPPSRPAKVSGWKAWYLWKVCNQPEAEVAWRSMMRPPKRETWDEKRVYEWNLPGRRKGSGLLVPVGWKGKSSEPLTRNEVI